MVLIYFTLKQTRFYFWSHRSAKFHIKNNLCLVMLNFHSFVRSVKFLLRLTVNNMDECLKCQSTTRYRESPGINRTLIYLGWHGRTLIRLIKHKLHNLCFHGSGCLVSGGTLLLRCASVFPNLKVAVDPFVA